jgi:Helix-turn-helix domain
MKVLTTSEAVREFRMHPITVLRLIQTQRVTATKDVNGRWLINKESLERWVRRRVRKAPKPERAAIAVGVGA